MGNVDELPVDQARRLGRQKRAATAFVAKFVDDVADILCPIRADRLEDGWRVSRLFLASALTLRKRNRPAGQTAARVPFRKQAEQQPADRFSRIQSLINGIQMLVQMTLNQDRAGSRRLVEPLQVVEGDGALAAPLPPAAPNPAEGVLQQRKTVVLPFGFVE